MRFSDILAASLVAPLVAAHGDKLAGMPKILGLGNGAALKARNTGGHSRRVASLSAAGASLNKRQGGADGRCGPAGGGASCDAGYCCSGAGWCGQGEEYCMAPDCLFDYGPACDANHLPSGGSTRNTPRTQIGNIAYGGEGVYFCTVPGTVAITYDDGPYIYTNDVLDLYASYGFKATFFVTGININKGSIDDASLPWAAMIKRMIAEGHQLASHTWSHQDLSLITQEQRYDQMIKNEMAMANIIGKFPTYMRPPYSSCSGQCPQDLADLGYVVSYFNLDSDDYNNVTPEKIQNAKDNVFKAINPSNPASDEFLGIAHDIHEQTAHNLTAYWLDLLVAKGYKGVTMGECLGEPESAWYRTPSERVATSSPVPSATRSATTSATSTGPTVTPTAVSTDGTCGPSFGLTCLGFSAGNCCSQYGYCGSTTDHCGTGCQAGFGNCGSSSGSSSAASSTASASATSSAPTSAPSGVISTDGSCGGANAYICSGSSFGNCCSQYGWCGASTDHCGTGCNALFGTCGSSSSSASVVVPASSIAASSVTAPSSTPSGVISTDGTCGGTSGFSCSGSSFGNCCSQYGWCGTSTDHCATASGCNPLFGTCASDVSSSSAFSVSSSTAQASSSSVVPSSSSTAQASSSSVVSSTSTTAQASSSPVVSSTSSMASSTQGSPSTTTTSLSSSLTTTTRPSSSSTLMSSTATPTPTNITKNGRCGKMNGGLTCKGFGNKQCCSAMGRCSNDIVGCGYGCQKKYGKCWW